MRFYTCNVRTYGPVAGTGRRGDRAVFLAPAALSVVAKSKVVVLLER